MKNHRWYRCYTPGPWVVMGPSPNDSEAEAIATEYVSNGPADKTSKGRYICWTSDTFNVEKNEAEATEEDKANGLLIAAAPDLFETLLSLVRCLSEDSNDYPDAAMYREVMHRVEEATIALDRARSGDTDG